MTEQPTSAADPRPTDRPFYVAPTCPDCGTLLVLWDALVVPPSGLVWHDEWWCRQCEALVMDWPPGEYEAMLAGEA